MVGLRATARTGEVSRSVMSLLSRVWKLIGDSGAVTLGINVFVYSATGSGTGGVEGEVAIVAGVLTKDGLPPPAGLELMETPSGPAVRLVHYGEYGGLGKAHQQIREWCQKNGRVTSGTNWEIYGHWEDDPGKRRTDIYYLLG